MTEFATRYLEVPGYFVKDHCWVKRGKDYHIFYITGRMPKGIDTHIGHASTRDFTHWQIHSRLTQEGAPFVIEKDGLFYLFYNRDSNSHPYCPIRLATSSDLLHWKSYPGNPVYAPSPKYYRYGPSVKHCRDFHVLQEGSYYYLLFCGLTKKGVGCVGVIRSRDLHNWEDLGPMFVLDHGVKKQTRCWWSGYGNPESPQLFKKDGLWHLFFTDNSYSQPYHLWSDKMLEGFSWRNAQLLFANENGYKSPRAATEVIFRPDGDLMSYYFWDLIKKKCVLRLREIGWEGPVVYFKY